MVSKRRKAEALSKSKFAEIIYSISHRFSLHPVFEDFLTMSLTACTQNPQTGKSYYEDEYLETIVKYKDSPLRFEFPKAFSYLVNEMEERFDAEEGNDVLGEFFEQHISNGRNGQFFTPFHICSFMAKMTHAETVVPDDRPLRVLDPSCGSGRMLIASHKILGKGPEHYGIDIDQTCVKMTALNLFLNGVFNSEVMCANALMPEDFVFSYRITLFPLGIFKITDKEKSRLWHLYRNTLQKERLSDGIVLDQTPVNERKKGDSSQLTMF